MYNKATILKRLDTIKGNRISAEQLFSLLYGTNPYVTIEIPENIKTLTLKSKHALEAVDILDTYISNIRFNNVQGSCVNLESLDVYSLNVRNTKAAFSLRNSEGGITVNKHKSHNITLDNIKAESVLLNQFDIEKSVIINRINTEDLNIERTKAKHTELFIEPVDEINKGLAYSTYISKYMFRLGDKTYKPLVVDGITVGIISEKTKAGISIYKCVNKRHEIIWVYSDGIVSAHGYTKEKAKQSYKFKYTRSKSTKEIIAKIKKTKSITRTQYRELTRACEYGVQQFAERIGKPNAQAITLQELKQYLKPHDFGYDQIKKLLGDVL